MKIRPLSLLTIFMACNLLVVPSLIPIDTIPVNPELQKVTPKELDSSFRRFTRGLKCYLRRKPCSIEDQKTVNRAGGFLLLALSIPLVGKLYTYAEKSTKQEDLQHKLHQAILELKVNQVQEYLKQVSPLDPEEEVGLMLETIKKNKDYKETAKGHFQQHFDKRIQDAISIIRLLKHYIDPNKSFSAASSEEERTSVREKLKTIPADLLRQAGLDDLLEER